MTNEALIQQCIYMLFSDAAILRLQMLSYIENNYKTKDSLGDKNNNEQMAFVV